MKVEAIDYGDRRVYAVGAFNRGVADWLSRLPSVWVEGEVTELRRQEAWQSVFFTLKDPSDGACLGVTMLRGRFDALRLERLVAVNDVPNAASDQLLQRLGFAACAETDGPRYRLRHYRLAVKGRVSLPNVPR